MGCCVGLALLADAARAEVHQGGALEVEIGGMVEALALIGDAREKQVGEERSPDFFTDTEVELAIEGAHDPTGLVYGAQISLDADTDDVENGGEAWLFVEGGFGEVRLGDDDGAVEQVAVGGFSVAVGTGGIDSDYIGTFPVTALEGTGDATKIVYFTPDIGGVTGVVSFTPSAGSEGQDVGRTDTDSLGNVVELAFEHAALIGEVDLLTGVSGLWGRFDTDGEIGDRSARGAQAGVAAEWAPYGAAAGAGIEDFGGFGRTWVNLGLSWTMEPVALSLTYGQVLATDDPDGARGSRPWNLSAGAELALFPGLVGSVELSWFDDRRLEDDPEAFEGDDRGLLGLARLALVF
jgi:hypothetical protein